MCDDSYCIRLPERGSSEDHLLRSWLSTTIGLIFVRLQKLQHPGPAAQAAEAQVLTHRMPPPEAQEQAPDPWPSIAAASVPAGMLRHHPRLAVMHGRWHQLMTPPHVLMTQH